MRKFIILTKISSKDKISSILTFLMQYSLLTFLFRYNEGLPTLFFGVLTTGCVIADLLYSYVYLAKHPRIPVSKSDEMFTLISSIAFFTLITVAALNKGAIPSWFGNFAIAWLILGLFYYSINLFIYARKREGK